MQSGKGADMNLFYFKDISIDDFRLNILSDSPEHVGCDRNKCT